MFLTVAALVVDLSSSGRSFHACGVGDSKGSPNLLESRGLFLSDHFFIAVAIIVGIMMIVVLTTTTATATATATATTTTTTTKVNKKSELMLMRRATVSV